jgi:tetratricopeptide (TPR) repeat protein
LLDAVLAHPKANGNALRALLQAYTSLRDTNQIHAVVEKLQALHKSAPGKDLYVALGLAEGLMLLEQTTAALPYGDEVLAHPGVDANSVLIVAQHAATAADYPRLERALEKLVKVAPDAPEAWYDLAALRASLNKMVEVMPALNQAIGLSKKRMKQDPKARDLIKDTLSDPRFAPLRTNPEFQRMLLP